MFDNAGAKIQTVAKILFWVSLFGYIVLAILCFGDIGEGIFGDLCILMGVIIIIVGPFLSWTQALLVYGFGEIVEKIPSRFERQKERKAVSDTLERIEKQLRALPSYNGVNDSGTGD